MNVEEAPVLAPAGPERSLVGREAFSPPLPSSAAEPSRDLAGREDFYPLPRHDPQAVGQAVARVLEHPNVARVTYQPGQPLSVYWFPVGNEHLDPGPDVHDASLVIQGLKQILEVPPSASPSKDLLSALLLVQQLGFYPTHIVIREESEFRAWLGLFPGFPLAGHLLWMSVVPDPQGTPQSAVVLGARSRAAGLAEAVVGVMIRTPTQTGARR